MKHLFFALMVFALNAVAQPIQPNNKKDAIPVLSADAIQQMVPAQGFVAFNKTTGCLNYYFGENWFELCGRCFPAVQLPHIDSFVQLNNILKVYSRIDSNSTLQYKLDKDQIWQPVEDTVLSVQIPALATSIKINMRSSNNCGTRDTTLVLSVKPLDIGQLDTININKKSFVTRKFGSTRWLCQDYPPSRTILQETPNFVALTDENQLCPQGWQIPAFSDWQQLLNNFTDNNKAIFELPDNNNISIGLSKLGLYATEEKKYYTQNAAYYWTRGQKEGKQHMVYITENGVRLLAEDAAKALMPIRCIRYE